MPGEPRALWASNRICEAAVRHRKQEQHLHNLRNVKASIDNKDPRRPKTSNGKAQRLLEERNNAIMHENTILLNKLSRILTREREPAPAPMLVKGLNENHKKGERTRIDAENQALLRRLQDVKSSVDAEKARREYELHESLLRNFAVQFTPNPFLAMSVNGDVPASGASTASGSRPVSRQKPKRPQSGAASSSASTPAAAAETEVPAAAAYGM